MTIKPDTITKEFAVLGKNREVVELPTLMTLSEALHNIQRTNDSENTLAQKIKFLKEDNPKYPDISPIPRTTYVEGVTPLQFYTLYVKEHGIYRPIPLNNLKMIQRFEPDIYSVNLFSHVSFNPESKQKPRTI